MHVRFAGICSSCTDWKSRLISFQPSPMKCWLKWNNGRRARLKRCIPLSLDALRLKIRDEGRVKHKAVSLALGICADDCSEVLGLWIEHTEGAKFWLKVFNELRNRGLARFSSPSLMGCMALRTLPNRLSADPVKPAVHLIRNSLAFANWKERKRLWKILSKAVRLAHSRSLAKCGEDNGNK